MFAEFFSHPRVMALEIVPVESPRDVRRFIDVTWHVYDQRRYPQWVPPLRIAVRDVLNEQKHPFYAHAARALWIARRDGRPVGRIAAIENRAHNAFYKDRVGFFGFFEAQNDPDAARALFDTAGSWLARRGFDTMRGPMNPSTNYECGLLVDGFEHHPVLMTTWNPAYYPDLLDGAGFTKAKDLLGWWYPAMKLDYQIAEGYARQAARAKGMKNVTFREIDTKNFAREIAAAWDVYNAAWEANWGFIPMSRAEFDLLGKDLKLILDPHFALAVEVDGTPAGLAIALPDFHEIFKRIPNGRLLPTGIFKLLTGGKHIHVLRVMVLGVKPQYRTRSIFPLILDELMRRGRQYGIVGAEASWVLEDNSLMNRPMEAMGAEPYRRWRIYDRPLGGAQRAREVA